MPTSPLLDLNDGRKMPQLGLGVWQTAADETAEVVKTAVAAGYRLVDTAMVYRNEAGVGEGVKHAGVPRAELFVTTKLWNDNQGFEAARRGFEASLARLGLTYVDLYLIHWPAPKRNLYLESWRALIRLREEGRIKSIGVSNFRPNEIERLISGTGITPAVNQVELHPRFQQSELRAFHATHNIVTQSWTPLGRGALFGDATLKGLAAKHGKSVPQVILRWQAQIGASPIPKSSNPGRIAENINVWDFQLDADDMAVIAALDDPGGRIGPDPDAFG